MYATIFAAITTFFVNPLFDLAHPRLPLFDHIPFLPYDRPPYFQMNYTYQVWTFLVGSVIFILNYVYQVVLLPVFAHYILSKHLRHRILTEFNGGHRSFSMLSHLLHMQ